MRGVVAQERIAKCADVSDLLDDVLPPLDAPMLDKMTFVLRDNFEPLKRIYRHYCTRGKTDARTAFALAKDNFGHNTKASDNRDSRQNDQRQVHHAWYFLGMLRLIGARLA